jgi:hypothetical protein
MNHLPLKPLKITLGVFQIFSKISEIFASQGEPLVSMTPAANLPLINNTVGKSCHGYGWCF